MSVNSPVTDSMNFFIGEDRVLNFTIKDASGAAVNITGWTLTWHLRVAPFEPAAVITKTIGEGIAITDGPNGVCQVTINKADTDSLPAGGGYVHALARTDSAASTVLAFGFFSLQISAAGI